MTGLKEGFKVSIISILGNILLSIFKLILLEKVML